MIKKYFSILSATLVLVMFSSCADEALSPILTFDKAGKGAYIKLISQTPQTFNLLDLANSSYTYSVEFVDLEKGALVSEYRLEASFQDRTPANGDASKAAAVFKSWSSSDFTDSANGFKSVENVSYTAGEVLSFLGLSENDLEAGDRLLMQGYLTLNDGSEFGAANSSAPVRGAAFGGHFDWFHPLNCPSGLAGTYDVTTTASWCGAGAGYMTQVTFTLFGDGYDVNDFSFGAYDVCYGDNTPGSGGFPLGTLRVSDVCNSITITGASQWNEIYTWSNMVVTGKEWSFDWVNDYGEGGSAIIHHPTGWPPLVLK